MSLGMMRVGLVGIWFVAAGIGGAFALPAQGAALPDTVASADCSDQRFGPGPDDWRRDSTVAGPTGVRKLPLQTGVTEGPAHRFSTKIQFLVEGHQKVVLSIPPRLRSRVALDFDLDHRNAGSVTFFPCEDRPRSIWPGIIRVKGRQAVQLRVNVEGDPTTHILNLGRPKPNLPTTIAKCNQAQVGSGARNWRRTALSAGPLGVRRHPLHAVFENRPGRFVTKMPVLVEGHQEVLLTAPLRLRHRILLNYGQDFRHTPAIVFRPCPDQPRTIWPGGIRIKGRQPVRLNVSVVGEPQVRVLRLGRP